MISRRLEVDGFNNQVLHTQWYGYKNPEYQSTRIKPEYLGISGYALIK